MDEVIVKKSKIGQFVPIGIDCGVFANRNFKKGEVVVKYSLRPLTDQEYLNLPETEKEFTHRHWGTAYLYLPPARYVNHSSNPNTTQDLKNRCDIAIRDIKKGEEITTDSTNDDTA